MLDIPCGAGATSINLLAITAALREASSIPRQPLEVYLVAGDISESARIYAQEMINRTKEDFTRQGIFVREKIVEWNVLDDQSTTALLHSWIDWARDCREYIAVLANFSGFLQTSGKFKQAQPQLHEVFRWTAQRRSTIIWIEPQSNTATCGLFPRIKAWLHTKLPSVFKKHWNEAESLMNSVCRYVHPIKPNCKSPRVQLSLLRLEGHDP